RDGEVELPAREAVLDELPDLVLERQRHLGSAHRDLAEPVVDRTDLGGESLPGALEFRGAIAGHAADHAGPPGGRVRTPEGSRAGVAASTQAGAQRRDWQRVARDGRTVRCGALCSTGFPLLMWRTCAGASSRPRSRKTERR